MNLGRKTCLPALLGSILWIAAAQEPPPATFHAGTELVQVNVIAQDKQGKPVTDLRREDFQLLDNGSPQEIRLFLAESDPPPPPKPGADPFPFTNRGASPSGSRSGYSVIAFDTLVTELADPGQGGSGVIWAKEKAMRALQSLPADDNVAIYATGKKIQVVREFTRDRASLEQQLRTWQPSIDTLRVGQASCAEFGEHSIGDCMGQDMRRRTAGTADEIGQIAEHLAGIPGRKNLVWIAWQFPLSPEAVQKLKNADIALYPMDAHGSVIGLSRDKMDATSPLRSLAAATGGIAIFDRDDLDVAIREVVEDGRVSYTLGFYPVSGEGPPKAHQLAVRINRPDVTLRYRNSYLPDTHRDAPTTKADLVKALAKPVDASGLPLRAAAQRTADRLRMEAVLDVSSLDLAQNQNRWTGKIEVVGQFTALDGTLVGDRPALAQTLELKLLPKTYEAAQQNGFLYRNELKIPLKAVEFKMLFANLASGKIGTVTIPLAELAPLPAPPPTSSKAR
ncbi:MAG TPA: VWA domain-containing protein [Bryobacteraceae bacterium]|jgi:VWFA-related protein